MVKASLPEDVETLQRLLIAAQNEAQSARAALLVSELTNEKLRYQIAVLKRARFGRSSEGLDTQLEQLALKLEDLETNLATIPPELQPVTSPVHEKPVRRPLPADLPREQIVHRPECTCPDCGGALQPAGEDVAEMLEWVPGRYKVIRHVRPKFACPACDKLIQAPAPSRPIARGMAGAALLAHVLVSKYQDHLPLYRQSQIFERDGIDLDRSTLADWVGVASELLTPLVEALGRYVMAGTKVHADDTPVPVLSPGRGKTKQGRLWTYVRDDRPAGSTDPPAVLFRYSPDRKGEHPKAHLAHMRGVLQADGYAGFDRLYGEHIQEAACWAHARRYFYEVHVALKSPIAEQALQRIAALYAIEEQVRGRSPDERRTVRQAHAGALLAQLHTWLQQQLSQIPKKGKLAEAIRYALARWEALVRYCNDGHLEIDNNAAERALRIVALGRKNWLFAGSDDGGERAAVIYSLLGSAKLNGINVEAYLRHILERLPEHPINRIEELLPWNVAPDLKPVQLAAA